MFWVKSAIISLFYFFIYLAFSNNTSIEVTNAKSAGHVVDNFSVAELTADAKPSNIPVLIESLNIRSTWTFEKGPGITPQGSIDRNYGEEFFKNESRFVCWEITLEHPNYIDNRDLNFTFTLFTDEGRKLTENKANSWIPANSEFSDHTACWGWPYPNSWDLGEYYFEIKPEAVSSYQTEDFPANIAFRVL